MTHTDPLEIVETSPAILSRVCRGKNPGCPDKCFYVLHLGNPVKQTAVWELLYNDDMSWSWKELGNLQGNVPAIEAIEKFLMARR